MTPSLTVALRLGGMAALALALSGCVATVEPSSSPTPAVDVSAPAEPSPSLLPSPTPLRPPTSPPAGNPAPD